MVMFVVRVTARMTAATRVPTVEILPTAKTLRRVSGAMDILRRVSAAKKMEATRVGWLAGRSRKALTRKGLAWAPAETALNACSRRTIGGQPRAAYRRLDTVMSLQRRSGVADSGRLVAAAGAFSWPVPGIAARRLGDRSPSGCRRYRI